MWGPFLFFGLCNVPLVSDADLPELVRSVSNLTHQRFLLSGKMPEVHATIDAPPDVTPAEAEAAFASVLEVNDLAVRVLPGGRIAAVVSRPRGLPPHVRFVARVHRLTYARADEAVALVARLRSPTGDVRAVPRTNAVVIDDAPAEVARMDRLLSDVDVPGAADGLWIAPLHYVSAEDVAQKLREIFEHGVPRILADERTNSLIVVGTERAYLRVIELLKRE
jgi:general secretion pathway protein D